MSDQLYEALVTPTLENLPLRLREGDGLSERLQAADELERLRGLITKARNSLTDYLPEYVERHLTDALAIYDVIGDPRNHFDVPVNSDTLLTPQAKTAENRRSQYASNNPVSSTVGDLDAKDL